MSSSSSPERDHKSTFLSHDAYSGNNADAAAPLEVDTNFVREYQKNNADWPLSSVSAGSPVERVRGWKFQKATLEPFFWAFLLTFGPCIGLLIYVLVCRKDTLTNNHHQLLDYSRGGRVVVLDAPLQRFLTFTKVVDTLQSMAITWVLALAAWIVADSWIESRKSGLTTKTLAIVTNAYASGRWWSLWETIVACYTRKLKWSKTFIQAITVLVLALLLSKLATGADFWLHYTSGEGLAALGTETILPNKDFSRAMNTTCWSEVPAPQWTTGQPCSVFSSAINEGVTWPGPANEVATNSSSTDAVAVVFTHSKDLADSNTKQTNMAIMTPADFESGTTYDGSTIGISSVCESISEICDLFTVAHGSSSWDCSNYSIPNSFNGSGPASYEPGLAMRYQVDESLYNLTASTTSLFLIGLMTAADSPEFAYGGGQNLGSALNIQSCTTTAYRVNYTVSRSFTANSLPEFTITHQELMNKNESDTLLAPTELLDYPFSDALNAAKASALISADALSDRLSYELARYSLAYAAGAVSNTETTDIRRQPDLKNYSFVQLAPLAVFIGLVLAYALLVLLLFIGAVTTGRRVVHFTDSLDQKDISLTSMAQGRLVRTDFLLYQLLSPEARKSILTKPNDLFRGEEDTVVVADFEKVEGGRFGVYSTTFEGDQMIINSPLRANPTRRPTVMSGHSAMKSPTTAASGIPSDRPF